MVAAFCAHDGTCIVQHPTKREHKMTRVEYETQNTAELPDLPTLAAIKDRISSLARATSTGRADDISISDIDAVPDSTKP
jgi:hypothetical protein